MGLKLDTQSLSKIKKAMLENTDIGLGVEAAEILAVSGLAAGTVAFVRKEDAVDVLACGSESNS